MSQTPNDRTLDRTIAWNTKVLAVSMALSWAVVQLLLVAGAPMLAELTGRPALAGFAPAIYVAWWAVATLVVGRSMDKRGRVPGIRFGFAAGFIGCVLITAGARTSSLAPFLVGVALTGGGAGAVNLARAAAADMYPPERRARGISFVLIGAAFGAILGPVAFIPLLARAGSDLDVLGPPFVVAAVVMLAGALLTLAIRVDPLDIAKRSAGAQTPKPKRRTKALLQIPLVRAALIAALIAQTVMTSMMSIVGLLLKQHGHSWPAAAISMSAHFLGMFGLVLVVGRIVDRIGQKRSILVGFAVLGGGVLAMLADVEPHFIAPSMFFIGVGWNLGFVAATAMIADSTEPSERAGLIGFVDFVSLMGGAVGSILAGLALDAWGRGALVGFGVSLSALPLVLFVLQRHTVRRPGVAGAGP